MLRTLAAMALAFALSACHSPSRVIEADKWTATQRQEQILLTERISHASTWDTGLKVTEGALPGVYKAEREDPEGIYFIGAGKPIWFSLPTKKGESTYVRKGGIYVPHNRTVPPHFVFVVESDAGFEGGINEYLLQSSVQSVAQPTNNFGAGTNIAGHAIAGALVMAMATSNDGKYARLFPIADASVRERIYASIQPSP